MERSYRAEAASTSTKHSYWHSNQMWPQNWIVRWHAPKLLLMAYFIRERGNLIRALTSVIHENYKASSVRLIPTRALSRVWGYLSSQQIPKRWRPAIYSTYGTLFGVNANEIELPLAEYPTLASFFRRRLKKQARVTDEVFDMVSPVDGKVLALGEVHDGQYIEQVKGCKFTMEQFLGTDVKTLIEEQRRKSQCAEEGRLFYAVFYLGPGDYHGVHSAADWTVDEARHIPGHLLSVSPVATRLIRSVLTINERLALNGHWKHGFFNMTCVGAFNVGSIKLEFDHQLRTNLRDTQNSTVKYEDISPSKGQCVAFFEFGSTVVLLFEAPNFLFSAQEKERVRVGQALGQVMYKSKDSHDK